MSGIKTNKQINNKCGLALKKRFLGGNLSGALAITAAVKSVYCSGLEFYIFPSFVVENTTQILAYI